MSNHVAINTQTKVTLETRDWAKLGINAAVVSIIAVLIGQALAIAIWPEIALFAPLDSYLRAVIFTLVPVIGATVLLAWLVAKQAQPVKKFITISIVVLIISIIPDYILPVEHKTVLASSVAACLHVVAAVSTVSMLVIGYQRQANPVV